MPARIPNPKTGSCRNVLTFIIILLIVGLIAGAIARLLVPGRDPIGLLGTIALGVLGSFVGGFLQNLIFHHTLSIRHLHPTGIIGSVIGAIILLLILRSSGHERGVQRAVLVQDLRRLLRPDPARRPGARPAYPQ